ncbi:unnamed protein product [Cyprideis torosa]|uniref:Coiled-coil domain-containing protein n=1 Tax=Cyprideis torosa TaxID=163714 RepID=A0A7R8WGZ3_9CRUS|nr:unnamed protein product [Cyprideis torosa]CAG0897182.1 unnamed protein product [Cyprideis torosa]
MPKKMGENSKAVVARARKAAAAEAAKEQKTKAEEDAKWEVTDKDVLRKRERQEERERKEKDRLAKKKEKEQLEREEQEALEGHSSAKAKPEKLTRAAIEERLTHKPSTPAKKDETSVNEMPLEENLNRLRVGTEEARSVDAAISLLSDQGAEGDRHPERRLKAAYAAFEEKRLPQLKSEKPSMRLSQLKQLLRKEWMKSPENPLNQAVSSYNAPKK